MNGVNVDLPFADARWETAGTRYLDMDAAQDAFDLPLDDATYTAKIFVENLLRNATPKGLETAVRLSREVLGEPQSDHPDYALFPTRLLLQDHSGLPVLADIASAARAGAPGLEQAGNGARGIFLRVPVDLVVDHSVEIQSAGAPDALTANMAYEFDQNRERFRFLKWASSSVRGLRLVPPGHGIVHQIHLESLAQLVCKVGTAEGGFVLAPDLVLGTDSHTPMVNGLGVVGWGVGGVEATAVALGSPVSVARPEIVCVRLTGRLRAPATATDLALLMTARLRAEGVVGAYVEFVGPGCAELSVPTRATVANMAPEYGCTTAVFPPDRRTLDYLTTTGRRQRHVTRVGEYLRAQRWLEPHASPRCAREIAFNLDEVVPTMAGPKRPSQTVPLTGVAQATAQTSARDPRVALAAITSCTNTSNPSVMAAAGLLARNARRAGLTVPPWVKTSMSPGSRSVTNLLERAGLLGPLEELGFGVAAYGCGTCIGNSGPLGAPYAGRVGVISGNRNFEGRIHPDLDAVFLASPPLVVAYALAGRGDVDLTTNPITTGSSTTLADLWPSEEEVARVVAKLSPESFVDANERLHEGDASWEALEAPTGAMYDWPESAYLRPTPFHSAAFPPWDALAGARVLVHAPDGTTTDHISPAGRISPSSTAGEFLLGLGVRPADFGTYGTRRGNADVLVRGTFGNTRFRNRIATPLTGPVTRHWPDGEIHSLVDVADRYARENVPALVLAGADYGVGSSRDWAAKGPALLGVRAVLAVSFERIHRSNLVGVGILPLQFEDGDDVGALGLDGSEAIDISLPRAVVPGARADLRALNANGETIMSWRMRMRLDTPTEVRFWRAGGALPATLATLARTRGKLQ